LIGKSSSPCQLKMREDRSLRSTPERWTTSRSTS
jgi:hypothetical protein